MTYGFYKAIEAIHEQKSVPQRLTVTTATTRDTSWKYALGRNMQTNMRCHIQGAIT